MERYSHRAKAFERQRKEEEYDDDETRMYSLDRSDALHVTPLPDVGHGAGSTSQAEASVYAPSSSTSIGNVVVMGATDPDCKATWRRVHDKPMDLTSTGRMQQRRVDETNERRNVVAPSSVVDHLRSASRAMNFGAGQHSLPSSNDDSDDECCSLACHLSLRPEAQANRVKAGCVMSSKGTAFSSISRATFVDVQEGGGTEVILCSADMDELNVSNTSQRIAAEQDCHQVTPQQSPTARLNGNAIRDSNMHSFFSSVPTTFRNAADSVSRMVTLDKISKQTLKNVRRISTDDSLTTPRKNGSDYVSPVSFHTELRTVSPDGSPLQAPRWPCMGHGCLRNVAAQDKAHISKDQKSVEGTIGMFLEHHGNWCGGWQAWSVYMRGTDTDGLLEPEDVRHILRNRAGDLSARARRIQSLRDDLFPFDLPRNAMDVVSDPGMEATPSYACTSDVDLRRTRSFPAKFKSSCTTNANTETAESVISVVSSGLESLQSCADPEFWKKELQIPEATAFEIEEEDLCYDSDPGELCPKRQEKRSHKSSSATLGRRNRHAVDTFLKNGAWQDDSLNAHPAIAGSYPNRTNAYFHVVPPNLNANERPPDLIESASTRRTEDQVWEIVKGMIHCMMTLVWHRTPCAGSPKLTSPVAVVAWIELGSVIQSRLVQPKLMWKPVNVSRECGGRLRKLNSDVHGVDLLDISRILEPNHVDRSRYPLAKRNCSFSVDTFDQSIMFEAHCEEERNRIVNGLKLAVARLGSKVIVGDDGVFDEFFSSSFTSRRPGEPPKWAVQTSIVD